MGKIKNAFMDLRNKLKGRLYEHQFAREREIYYLGTISLKNQEFIMGAYNLTKEYETTFGFFDLGLLKPINPRDLTQNEAEVLAYYELEQASAQRQPSCTPQIPTSRKKWPEDSYNS